MFIKWCQLFYQFLSSSAYKIIATVFSFSINGKIGKKLYWKKPLHSTYASPSLIYCAFNVTSPVSAMCWYRPNLDSQLRPECQKIMNSFNLPHLFYYDLSLLHEQVHLLLISLLPYMFLLMRWCPLLFVSLPCYEQRAEATVAWYESYRKESRSGSKKCLHT